MRSKICGFALLTLTFLPSSFASTITKGSFDIAGTVFVTNFTTSAVVTPAGTCPASGSGMACIFWEDSAGTTVGKVDISATGLPNGDILPSIAGNDAANISSLETPPEIVDVSGFPATPFMSFNNGVTTQLLINFIDAGIYSSAGCTAAALSAQECTIPGSLFSFVNNPPPSPAGTPCGNGCEATAAWVFEGVTAGNPGNQSSWVGNFTSQFPLGVTFQEVFARLKSQGFVSNTFSGTITLTPPTTVPEPGTFAMMIGAGMVGLAALSRRRRAGR